MLLSGPPSQHWCMHFEARHNFFKELARVSRCFKNICKTLAKRAQFALATAMLQQRLFKMKGDFGPSVNFVIASFPDGIRSTLMNEG
jgi:hypothetical protein